MAPTEKNHKPFPKLGSTRKFAIKNNGVNKTPQRDKLANQLLSMSFNFSRKAILFGDGC